MTFAPGIQSVRPRFLPAPLPGRVYSRPTLPNLPWGDGPMSPIHYQRDVTMVAGPAYYARAERGDGVLAGLGILSTDDLTAGVKNALKRNLPIIGVALGAIALGGIALWTVLRKPKPARKNKRRNAAARPFYVSTFCNFAHDLKTGRPIGHECYILDPKKLQLEREDRFDEIGGDIRKRPLQVVRGRRRNPFDQYDRARIRSIVRAASKLTSDPTTKSWLFLDERGTWEKDAERLLEKAYTMPASGGMTESAIDAEVADMLAYTALTAQLAHRKGRGRRRNERWHGLPDMLGGGPHRDLAPGVAVIVKAKRP